MHDSSHNVLLFIVIPDDHTVYKSDYSRAFLAVRKNPLVLRGEIGASFRSKMLERGPAGIGVTVPPYAFEPFVCA